jgi:hypothetical protein
MRTVDSWVNSLSRVDEREDGLFIFGINMIKLK